MMMGKKNKTGEIPNKSKKAMELYVQRIPNQWCRTVLVVQRGLEDQFEPWQYLFFLFQTHTKIKWRQQWIIARTWVIVSQRCRMVQLHGSSIPKFNPHSWFPLQLLTHNTRFFSFFLFCLFYPKSQIDNVSILTSNKSCRVDDLNVKTKTTTMWSQKKQRIIQVCLENKTENKTETIKKYWTNLFDVSVGRMNIKTIVASTLNWNTTNVTSD